MPLFWELQQQHRINQASTTAGKAASRVAKIESEVNQLGKRVERLSLASQAMWELLRDHTAFEEEQILAKMEEIDLRDGASDGKIETQVLTCSACHRRANSKRLTCVYCGAPLARPHLFE